MKFKFEENDFIGAIVVIENYLDGAVADYEGGEVEDDTTIWSCINALKRLGSHWYQEYEERMLKHETQRMDR